MSIPPQCNWIEIGKELTKQLAHSHPKLKAVKWDTLSDDSAREQVIRHIPVLSDRGPPTIALGYHAIFNGLKGDPTLNERFLLVCHIDRARGRVIVDATTVQPGEALISDIRMVSLPIASVVCCLPMQTSDLGALYSGNIEAAGKVQGFDMADAWVLRPYPQPGLPRGAILKVEQAATQWGGTVLAGWDIFGIGTKDWKKAIFTSEFCPVFRRARDGAMIHVLPDIHNTGPPKLFFPDPFLNMMDVTHFLNLTDMLWGSMPQLLTMEDSCIDVKSAKLTPEYRECMDVRQRAIEARKYLVSRKLLVACKKEGGNWSPEKTAMDTSMYMGLVPIALSIHDVCAHCEMHTVNAKTCGRCGSVKYCSEQCQLMHWATHKHHCCSPEERRRRNDAEAAARANQEAVEKAAADRERKEKDEAAAAEAARRQRVAASREERARAGPAGFTITHPQIAKERVVGRARTADEERQHDLHVDPVEKALRSIAFDEKQETEHTEKLTRKGKAARAKRRQLEKAMGAAEAAATHHVPAKPTLADVVDDALRG